MAYGPYELSDHALRRMRERRITHDEVQAVVAGPTMDLPAGPGSPRRKLRRTVAGRRLAVVIGPGRMSPLVVFSVWDEDSEE
jgi:hypothetical protein